MMSRFTFISHRHTDAEIAQALRNYLVDCGVKDVFLSSYPQSGPRIVGELDDEIRINLLRAKLVILFFPSSDQDWTWCAYECGLAGDPKGGRTNLAIFQCTDDRPHILDHKYLIKLNEIDITRFCQQIHKDENMWPGLRALGADISDIDISRRARGLLDDLEKAVPRYRREEKPRWDSFCVELVHDAVAELEELSWDDENEKSRICEIVAGQGCVSKSFGVPEYHFGYDALAEDTKLEELIERWRSRVPRDESYPDGWIDALAKDLWLAATNRPAEATWQLFRSVWRRNREWLTLALSSATRETDGRMFFRFFSYLVPDEVAELILASSKGKPERSRVVRLQSDRAS